jgi:hypothetical protein
MDFAYRDGGHAQREVAQSGVAVRATSPLPDRGDPAIDLEEMLGNPAGEMGEVSSDRRCRDRRSFRHHLGGSHSGQASRNEERRCASHVGVHLAQNGAQARGASGA